jgi:hypothetical protein
MITDLSWIANLMLTTAGRTAGIPNIYADLRTVVGGVLAARRGGLAAIRSGLAARRGGLAARRGGLAAIRSGLAARRGGLTARRGGLAARRGGQQEVLQLVIVFVYIVIPPGSTPALTAGSFFNLKEGEYRLLVTIFIGSLD